MLINPAQIPAFYDAGANIPVEDGEPSKLYQNQPAAKPDRTELTNNSYPGGSIVDNSYGRQDAYPIDDTGRTLKPKPVVPNRDKPAYTNWSY